ncbi:MAG: hypothetical protein NTX11_00085 [Candidatus Saccharibacteria bacterium]|nr:hypothetical protein [Candidatus Saccharibacteria bacterium]
MIIIGITGPIGHGKSTLAQNLVALNPSAQQFESSEVISEIASQLNTFFMDEEPASDDLASVNQWLCHLPDILAAVLGNTYPAELFVITKEQITTVPRDFEKLFEYINLAQKDPALVQTQITQVNKADYRAILQWIGGFCVNRIRRTIWNDELIRRATKSGCSMAILGGVRFAEEAENIKKHGGIIVEIERSHAEEQDIDDPTERERSQISADVTIRNDHDLADLKNKSIKLYEDIRANKLQTIY